MNNPNVNAVTQKKKRSAAGIASAVITGLMLIIIAILIFFLLAGAHKGQSVGLGGYRLLAVLTGSMEPEISAGDLIIVKRVDSESLTVGDIATFRVADGTSSIFLTHRIVAAGGGEYITRGDANNIDDPGRKTFGQVEGKYLFKISGLGAVIVYMSSPSGLVLAGIVFVAYVLIEALAKTILKKT